jgi:NAD(P)-dependent dehydrogenase (short-subunit alcohol dehydrogenase family)
MISNTFRTDLFAGKVAYIAGGTSGINLGIAKGLATLGAKVAVVGRNPEKAASAAAEINEINPDCAIGLSADVRDYDLVDASLNQTVAAFGNIDIVISGAAGNFLAPAIGLSSKGFRTVVDIDLIGTYNVFHASFNYINKPGASLIAITAGQAVNALTYQAHVAAAKAGINQLIRCLALEWGPAGVRVNGISPGPIAETEGMARLVPTQEIEDAMTAKIALRRFGTKDEIADSAAFLSSDAARYITGIILDCGGGVDVGDASPDCLTPPPGR